MNHGQVQRNGVEFDALEYAADDSFHTTRLRFVPEPDGGWRIERNGQLHLELGQGYRLLRSRSCGVCATDLDRRFLPFPLPQVIGHEVVAEDESGKRFVIEINASHAARGVEIGCPFCAVGLDTHCPDRLVLGIHDLPGGFGPYILAPEHALVALPPSLDATTAALVEPFAAALRAVGLLAPAPGKCVAVLGPGRLGLLVVAALAAYRRLSGHRFEIVALGRRSDRLACAIALGADRAESIAAGETGATTPLADIVVDTTGSPDGFALACSLASTEVHVKSTHGQPGLGLSHLTEAVVDELRIMGVDGPGSISLHTALCGIPPLCRSDRLRVGWLGGDAPPQLKTATTPIEWIRADDPLHLQHLLDAEAGAPGDLQPTLPRVDAIVLDDEAFIDAAIRPITDREASPVRPTGAILARTKPSARGHESPLGDVLARGLQISSSRCGDFRQAVEWLAHDSVLQRLGDEIVSHRFAASALGEAFACARSPEGLKVLVEHPGSSARQR